MYNDSLKAQDFRGEGHTRHVLVVKTHAPWHAQSLPAGVLTRGVVLLTRNPIDAIPSYWNWLQISAPQSMEEVGNYISPEYARAAIQRTWERWCRLFAGREAIEWRQQIALWRQRAKEMSVPLLTVRYEDLRRDPRPVVIRVLQFIAIEARPDLVDELQSWRRNEPSLLDLRRVACAVATQENPRIHRAHDTWQPRLTLPMRELVCNLSDAAPDHFLRELDYADRCTS